MNRAELLEILRRAEQTLVQIRQMRQDIANEVNSVIDVTVLTALKSITIEEMRPYFPRGTRVAALNQR